MTATNLHFTIRRKRHTVATFADASAIYSAARDRSGLGSSRFPGVEITDDAGTPVARISYNGRVWPAGPYTPGAEPLYDNNG